METREATSFYQRLKPWKEEKFLRTAVAVTVGALCRGFGADLNVSSRITIHVLQLGIEAPPITIPHTAHASHRGVR